ncbi:MAG: hypothetical protein JJU32_10175 [Phormidium sp. BM_Day4_Bin.17]|nr:hypothetical protein [Phormidium sp. BM_Day4_Bin.17]UCJ12737.1 MAG: hypothetical protein JWS08_02690 [Phormidium sp. PBR-2020]
MSLSPPSTRPHPHHPPAKHTSETCRLWEQECLRAWLQMKQDITDVKQRQQQHQHQPH